MSHGLDIWRCLKHGGHSGIFVDENTKTSEGGLCFLHAFSNFLLPDLFLWSLDHKIGGRRSFRVYRGRGYFYMVCSWSIVIPDYAHPQLAHFNKEGWFCSAQPTVLDVDCSLSPTLRNSFDLEPTIMQMCACDQLWSRQMTSFPSHRLLPQPFLLSLYSRAGSLPNPLLDIYSKLKTEVIILFFNLVWLCE